MCSPLFEFGEHVRHPRRPEWGVGSISRAESIVVDGTPAQRLSIRFPGAGIKTLVTAHVELERVDRQPAGEVDDVAPAHAVRDWAKMTDDEWLGSVASRKVQEAMIALPESVRDPFVGPQERLDRALRLYRFDQSGRGLVDWAIAQSGMDDPLSRFNRHELEQYFERWATERDNWLVRILREDQDIRRHVRHVIGTAPPSAQRLMKRITGAR